MYMYPYGYRTIHGPNGRAGVQNSTLANAQFPSLLSGTGTDTGPRTLIFTVCHLVCDAIDMGQTVEIQGSCRRESVSGSLLCTLAQKRETDPWACSRSEHTHTQTMSNFEAGLSSIGGASDGSTSCAVSAGGAP